MACCPYAKAKDKTIRDRWFAYKDSFSSGWARYFGIAAWNCESSFWNCHGNFRHGAREEAPEGKELHHALRNLARANMISRKEEDQIMPGLPQVTGDFTEFDRMPQVTYASTFNGLDDHMFAREEAMRQNADMIADKIGTIREHFAQNGLQKADKGKFTFWITAECSRSIGTGATQACDGMMVDIGKAAFQLAFDPTDDTLYEVTGYPLIAEDDYAEAIPSATEGRCDFIH